MLKDVTEILDKYSRENWQNADCTILFKAVTETPISCSDEMAWSTYSVEVSGVRRMWQWTTETRYSRYDRFLEFVMTLCALSSYSTVPAEAEKGRYVV